MRATAPGQSSADASGTHELAPLVASWRRSLNARGRSPKTVTIYTSEADAFGRYLARLISNVGGSGPAHAEPGPTQPAGVVIVPLSLLSAWLPAPTLARTRHGTGSGDDRLWRPARGRSRPDRDRHWDRR